MPNAIRKTVADAATLTEAASTLGELIALGRPAPEDATRRFLADERYATALYATRKLPAARDALIASAASADRPDPAAASSARAVAKAAGALLKWGMAGLEPAPPWVIAARLAACAGCDQRRPAPRTLVYRGAEVLVGKDATICARCGCLTNTKAAIARETCPLRSAGDPTRSRWGEPYVEAPAPSAAFAP